MIHEKALNNCSILCVSVNCDFRNFPNTIKVNQTESEFFRPTLPKIPKEIPEASTNLCTTRMSRLSRITFFVSCQGKSSFCFKKLLLPSILHFNASPKDQQLARKRSFEGKCEMRCFRKYPCLPHVCFFFFRLTMHPHPSGNSSLAADFPVQNFGV